MIIRRIEFRSVKKWRIIREEEDNINEDKYECEEKRNE